MQNVGALHRGQLQGPYAAASSGRVQPGTVLRHRLRSGDSRALLFRDSAEIRILVPRSLTRVASNPDLGVKSPSPVHRLYGPLPT